MVGGQFQSLPKLLLPRGRGLSHAGIDQVKTVAAEIFLGQCDGVLRFGHTVFPAKGFQVIIPERLDPQRHPVNAGSGEIPEFFRLDTGRVGLEGDFRAVRQGPVFADPGNQPLHRPGRHQRRRTTAKKNAADGARPAQTRIMIQFPAQGLKPELLVNAFAHMAVEIAVRAFGPAKGPVHINGKGIFKVSCLVQNRP